jgi:hypothetical protein
MAVIRGTVRNISLAAINPGESLSKLEKKLQIE